MKETLVYFDQLCSDSNTKWNLDDLHCFCRTRRLGYNDRRSKPLPVGDLLSRIRTQLELESVKGRSKFIHSPDKSQDPARKRRMTLVREGVLNSKNCCRLINVKVPDDTVESWRYVKRDDLIDMGFPDVAYQWFADFSSNWKHMWTKGSTCFWEGRAYDFRWIGGDRVRWFRFKTKRTMMKGAMCVHISFHKVGKVWKVRSARCNNCIVGKNHWYIRTIVVKLYLNYFGTKFELYRGF